jgi:branched-chain amino acid transport system substrate-binding protein
MRAKSLFVLGGLLLQIGLLISCSREPESLKIGLSINLSGRGGTAGEYIRDGALLAVDEINANGGINGRPLELLVEDDKSTSEGVRRADKKLMDLGVVAIIGHSYSDNTLIAYPLVTGNNVLLFTPYTATTELTGKDDLFCRTAVDNNLYGRALAKILTERGHDTVSFLLDMSNASFVEDYFRHTEKYFSGRMHAVRMNSKEEVDWQVVLADLLQPQPQAIVLLNEVTITGICAQKLRADGFRGDLLATIWAQTPDLPRYGGKAVEGMTIITFMDPEVNGPDYLRFEAKMREKFNKAGTARSSRAYEAVSILAQALRRSPPEPTAGDLKNALLENRFESILGSVRFDATCDVDRPVYAVTVADGGYKTMQQIETKGAEQP